MFALFYSLFYSMFVGAWTNYSILDINSALIHPFSVIGQLLTSIFGDVQYTTFGEDMYPSDYLHVCAFVLALITSIGIVVMAVKGIKRIFSVFFYGVR